MIDSLPLRVDALAALCGALLDLRASDRTRRQARSNTPTERALNSIIDAPIESALRLTIRSEGARLDRLAGHTGMLDAAAEVEHWCPGARRLLDESWHGIGDWQRPARVVRRR